MSTEGDRMTIAHFLLIDSDAPDTNEPGAFLQREFSALAGLSGVERLDRYEPVEFDHPMNDDDERPLLLLQTCYRDVASLEKALASDVFQALIETVVDGAGYTLSHDALEMKSFPVADASESAEWTAPISFVVRYHHPAEDPEEFVRFYVANHPVIEKHFPDIRNIKCYVPVAWTDPTDLARQNYMLGNEVVFDSVAALGAALTSPVMKDMKEDLSNFPPSSGKRTHFAMRRQRIV
jgi:uncharacterized protein (TIGR02118 family)